MLKKMTAVILALVLGLISCQVVAVAAQKDDNAVEPRYTHIATINGSISIEDGTAVCYATGRSRYAETTTVVRVTLQKRAPTSEVWTTVYSWTGTAEGTATAQVLGEKTVTAGYDYRIYITCTIKDAEGVIQEKDTMYSRIVSY